MSLIFSLICGYFFANLVRIKKIILKPNSYQGLSFESLKGQSLLLFDTRSLEKTLKKNYPEIENLEITKKYPQTLIIRFEKAKYTMQIRNNNEYLLISRKNKIIKKIPSPLSNLIIVDYYQKLRNFETKKGFVLTNFDLQYVNRLIQAAGNYPTKIKSIEIVKPNQITVQLSDQTEILLNTKKRIAKNWRIVHNIIKSLKIRGEKPKTINLLFDKPFITL